MRVVVLGATGFLGSWVARALVADGHEVVAIVRPSSRRWRIDGMIGLAIVEAPEHDWPAQIERLVPEVLVSLDWAGVASGLRDDEGQWQNLNRQRAVFAAAVVAGTRRFVGVGSQAEYGPRADRIVESADLRPTTLYGEVKVAALAQLRDAADRADIEWVWARVFSVYGPMDNRQLLLSTIAEALLVGRDVELSSGEQLWSYLYAADAAAGLALLSTNPDASGVYNLGHPIAPRLRNLVEEFATHFSTDGKLLFADPSHPRAGSPLRLEPNMARLHSLGWAPHTPSSAGLRMTADWLQGARVPDPFQDGRALPREPTQE